MTCYIIETRDRNIEAWHDSNTLQTHLGINIRVQYIRYTKMNTFRSYKYINTVWPINTSFVYLISTLHHWFWNLISEFLWWKALKNHDYWGNTLAQLSLPLRSKYHWWQCERSSILRYTIFPHGLQVGGGSAYIFFVDTSSFIDHY